MRTRIAGLLVAFAGAIILASCGFHAAYFPMDTDPTVFAEVLYGFGGYLVRIVGAGAFLLGAMWGYMGTSQAFSPKEGFLWRISASTALCLLFSMLASFAQAKSGSIFTGGYGGVWMAAASSWIAHKTGSFAALCIELVLLVAAAIFLLRSIVFAPPVPKAAPVAKAPAQEHDKEKKPRSKPEKPKAQGRTELPLGTNEIDPRDDVRDFVNPSTTILEKYTDRIHPTSKEEIAERKDIIKEVLGDFNVSLDRIDAVSGPTVTLFKLFPAKAVKVQSVLGRRKELSLGLKEKYISMDMLADSVGLEVPNAVRSVVPLRSLVESEAFQDFSGALPVAVGYTIDMKPRIIDLAKAPHLLIAGTTGGGKSVSMHSIIMSLLYSKHPSEVKLVLIDPKLGTEFGCYRPLASHYLALLPEAGSESEEQSRSIVTDRKTTDKTLRALRKEMDERYVLFDKAGVSKIDEYNAKYCRRRLLPTDGHRFLPYIVVVIDEFGDLIKRGYNREESELGSRINATLISLSALGRAAGIHLVMATQSPTVEVISSLIRNNLGSQMALMCKDGTQSRVIMDATGAENLIGNGDMILCTEKRRERVQGAFVDKPEIQRTVKAIASQKGWRKCPSVPFYLPEVPEDEEDGGGSKGGFDPNATDTLFAEAARYVVTTQMASTSDLQAQMGLGFPRARKIMSQLQAAGIVGPQNGSRPREVLIDSLDALDNILK